MSAQPPQEEATVLPPLIDEKEAAKYEIHAAARDGRLAKVEQLLKENPRLAYRFDNDGRQPIHWAVAYNRLDAVKLLMEQPKFDIDAADELGWTPLMIACSRKDGDELVEMILDRDPDVNLTDNLKQTALQFAVSKDRYRVVDMLLKRKASPLIPDHINRYPIHRAAAIGSLTVLKSLLQEPGQLNRADRDGLTALHHAIAEGHSDAAYMLIEEGADTGKKSSSGKLPIEMSDDINVARRICERAKSDGIKIVLPGDEK